MKSLEIERVDAPRARTWTDDQPDDERVTLGAIAVPAVRVRDTTPLRELRALLVDLRVPAIVVTDASDTLVGVITRTDVLRHVDRPDEPASDVMSRFVFALPHLAAVERAAALMAYESVGFVIVTGEDQTLCGTVSALDLARHYAMEAGYLVG
jgi:CBS domain-containing protein